MASLWERQLCLLLLKLPVLRLDAGIFRGCSGLLIELEAAVTFLSTELRGTGTGSDVSLMRRSKSMARKKCMEERISTLKQYKYYILSLYMIKKPYGFMLDEKNGLQTSKNN